ncbi:MAG TPA: hypothetical protein PKY12_03755 [Catalimonadaceae bacterium]|jgi:hypothetical protein|nr:hypothetical protein [Catalimonadaceae bacterium]
MKKIIQQSAFLFICIGFALSCSQSKTSVSSKDKEIQKQREEQFSKAEKHPTSIFPFFIAGTLGIIQQVYFNKAD